MARTKTFALAIATMAALGACAQRQQEVAYVEPAPVTAEPAYTKY